MDLRLAERQDQLLEDLREIANTPAIEELAQYVEEVGGPMNARKLLRAFENAAAENEAMHDLYALADEARELRGYLGDELHEEIADFLEKVDSLSAAEYRDLYAFVSKVFRKDEEEGDQKPGFGFRPL